MAKRVNYFEARRQYTETDDSVLVSVPSRIIPAVLSAIETRKARSFWLTNEDYDAAYQALTKFQERLLMDAAEYLARAIFYSMGYARDVELAPDRFPLVELPEATLFAIRTRLGDPGDLTIYSRVEAIRLLIEANAGADAEQLGELVKIVALLSA